ncbi:hypothetical protein ZIOFF_059958 [Zingiber officinale]|uniref:Uncharacterized protein n=1 Tax=Zingiber officinale TaxID=94328 RepID=A0A8J5F9Z5_ZINOF|nr:hypothetical protein ZIOFF_059958 [Zingiber officinale]
MQAQVVSDDEKEYTHCAYDSGIMTGLSVDAFLLLTIKESVALPPSLFSHDLGRDSPMVLLFCKTYILSRVAEDRSLRCCTFSDILKVNGGIQKLQLNSSGMDDYRSNNYMLCDTASKPRGVTGKYFDEELSRSFGI